MTTGGNMGYPLAARVAARFEVLVSDLDTAAVARASAAFGAVRIETPADLAATGIVVLCLPSPTISEAVLRQIAPVLPKGAVVLETSTMNPSDIAASRRIVEPFGIALVDASIMAGVAQMVVGTASLALGGSEAAIAAAQGVLDAIAVKQVYFGASGAGAAAKVINDAVAHAVMIVVAQAGSLATAAGVDVHKLIEPIELVVGFAPGGGTDTTARTLAVHLARRLNTSVVLTNKPGASGEIGFADVARAKPDGYVIGMTKMPGLATLPIERATQYELTDFVDIANLVKDPSAFSVVNESRYKNLADLVADAKARPGEVTDDHLAMVQFERLTGTRLDHIPFSGAGPLRNATPGGQVDVGGLNLGEVVPFRSRMRVLAEAGAARSTMAPDVPTFAEQKVPLVFGSERGIMAPKGVPAEGEKRLGDVLREIAADPEFRNQMVARSTEMDDLAGAAWTSRPDGQADGFATLWKTSPWGDAQRK